MLIINTATMAGSAVGDFLNCFFLLSPYLEVLIQLFVVSFCVNFEPKGKR